jgi:hypothetical protein
LEGNTPVFQEQDIPGKLSAAMSRSSLGLAHNRRCLSSLLPSHHAGGDVGGSVNQIMQNYRSGQLQFQVPFQCPSLLKSACRLTLCHLCFVS